MILLLIFGDDSDVLVRFDPLGNAAVVKQKCDPLFPVGDAVLAQAGVDTSEDVQVVRGYRLTWEQLLPASRHNETESIWFMVALCRIPVRIGTLESNEPQHIGLAAEAVT